MFGRCYAITSQPTLQSSEPTYNSKNNYTTKPEIVSESETFVELSIKMFAKHNLSI